MSADGVATPYFLLIQMNNAPLLEAYAMLGIEPVAADIREQHYPDGFDLQAAVTPQAKGADDKAEHPGKASGGADPIRETESETHGAVDEMIGLASKIAGRFGTMVSDGADFGAMVQEALGRAKLPGFDFDPDILATGAAVLGRSQSNSSCRADWAGQLPFTGFRADYRPETAPDRIRGAKAPNSLTEYGYELTHSPADQLRAIAIEVMASRIHKSR